MNKTIIANLKMFMVYDDIEKFNIDKSIIVCPSDIFIPYFLKKNYNICLQNVSSFSLGNHTGSVCYEQAKSLGINYTLLGHSEIRNIDTDNDINKKIIMGIKNNFNIILCVGEKEKTNGLGFLKEQILNDLKNIKDLSRISIAYEPVWCIGTGYIPNILEIETKIDYIRTIIKKEFNQNVKIFYGGSVDDETVKLLKNISDIDGFIIGEASLNTNKLKKIIENFK